MNHWKFYKGCDNLVADDLCQFMYTTETQRIVQFLIDFLMCNLLQQKIINKVQPLNKMWSKVFGNTFENCTADGSSEILEHQMKKGKGSCSRRLKFTLTNSTKPMRVECTRSPRSLRRETCKENASFTKRSHYK